MPAYPIEVLNFGDSGFTVHESVIRTLNSLQEDFLFSLPSDHNRTWASHLVRQHYETNFVWDALERYRSECKGFHPYVIAIVHGPLASNELGNLFGSRNSSRGLAVITTNDWNQLFSPPPLDVYLSYYLVRYLVSFISPNATSHVDTRNCYFDKKIHKRDIYLSMKSGQICDECRSAIEVSIDSHIYASLLKLIQHVQGRASEPASSPSRKPQVFIGSSDEHRAIAEILHMNLDTDVDCHPWYGGEFILSSTNLENLDKLSSAYDYAILVVDPDDITTKRGNSFHTPRDNVVFELGLFMGRLGRKSTFIVYCKDNPPSLPSDLLGVAGASYRRRADNNLELALQPVCTRLKKAMRILR